MEAVKLFWVELIKSKSHLLIIKHIFSNIIGCIAKGQLISKCPFGVILWTKITTKNLTNFCPRI